MMKLNQQQLEIISETSAHMVGFMQAKGMGKEDLPRLMDMLREEQLQHDVSPRAADAFCRDIKDACLKLWAVIDGEALVPADAVLGTVRLKK